MTTVVADGRKNALPSRIDALFAEGVRRLQAGDADRALPWFRQVLADQPDHPSAQTLLGAAHCLLGDWPAAITATARAIRLGGTPGAWSNRGVALRASGRAAEAADAFRRAAALRPDHHESVNNLGVMNHALGRVAAAAAAFRHALALVPDYAEARSNLTAVEQERNDPAIAAEAHRRLLRQWPNLPEAHQNISQTLITLGRAEEAADHARRAVALRPDNAQSYDLLGNALRRCDRAAPAFDAHRWASRLEPDSIPYLLAKGAALLALRRIDEALDLFRRATAAEPLDPNGWNLLGMARKDGGAPVDAEITLRRAIRLAPDYPDAHNNLGNALLDQNRLEEAERHYRVAVALGSVPGEAYVNVGLVRQKLNDLEGAERLYVRAMRVSPECVGGPFNLGMLKLLTGRLAEGWTLYEHRWRLKEAEQRSMPRPAWSGERLAGKRLLLHAEQGMGDSIQMLRYVPILAKRAALVVVEVPKPLARLARTLPGGAVIVERGQPVPNFDLHAPLMSLPHLMGTDTVSAIPSRVPYVSTTDEAVARWSNAIGPGEGPRVGLVWSGNPGHTNDRNRSMPVEEVRRILEVDGVTFLLLQKEPRPREEAMLMDTGRCRSFGPLTDDFADTAALISALDLVISVDTSVGHLAGALGRPAWMMIPFSPDWRWFLDRGDSPWYPSLRLYRQDRRADWHGVVERVRRDLAALATRNGQSSTGRAVNRRSSRRRQY